MQVSPVSLALQDRNPYVRRTAVLGVLKIYNLDAAAVRNAGIEKNSMALCLHLCSRPVVCKHSWLAGMLEDLHNLLQSDPDAQVVANCISVLLEVINFHMCSLYMHQVKWL